jgi:hypothetical protein
MEASYTSQFIAIGLIIELVFFQRKLRMAILALGIVGTLSGTGIMLILLTLPLLLRRVWRQVLLMAVVLMPLLGIVAASTGWYELVSRRAGTFDKTGSSANGRFIVPYTDVLDLLAGGNQHKIIYGLGPGKLARSEAEPDLTANAEFSAIPAVFLSYGMLTLASYLVFTTYCLFGSGVPLTIMWAAALEYHLMGGHLSMPPILNYCFILTSGWAIRASPIPRRSSRATVAPAP